MVRLISNLFPHKLLVVQMLHIIQTFLPSSLRPIAAQRSPFAYTNLTNFQLQSNTFSNRQLQRKHNYFQKENLKQHFGDKYLTRNRNKFLCDSDCQLEECYSNDWRNVYAITKATIKLYNYYYKQQYILHKFHYARLSLVNPISTGPLTTSKTR